jgi:hypothetical protein
MNTENTENTAPDARRAVERNIDVEASADVRTLEQRMRLAYALFWSSRALESLALGWLACASTLACAVLSRSESPGPPGPQAWAASTIAGVCAALAWWFEHAPECARFVRRVDAQSGAEGAVVTAVEAARDRARNPVSGLLVARIVARVPARAWTRAAAPRAIAVLAAPLLGLAIALAAIDAASSATGASTGGTFAAASLASAARSLRAVAAHPGAPGASEPLAPGGAPLARLAGELDTAAREMAIGGSNPNRLRNELARLEQELLKVAGTVDPRSEVGAAVASGLDAASSARSGLELARMAEPAAGARPGSHTAEGERAGASPGDADAARALLAGSATNGRMSAPGEPNAGAPTPGARDPASGAGATLGSRAAGSEGALASGRWWPSTYDAVVERWVEGSRGERR